MFLRRSRRSYGPVSKPACLFFLATAFACLLLFLTAQPGQAAQRPQGGLSLAPRIDPLHVLEKSAPPLRTELHKNFVLLKTQAARSLAAGDVLAPECPLFSAPPRCNRNPIIAASLDAPCSRIAKPAARGPPARF